MICRRYIHNIHNKPKLFIYKIYKTKPSFLTRFNVTKQYQVAFRIKISFLTICTKVDKMHDGMKPGLEEDEPPGELVEVNVVIKRYDAGKAHVTEEGDGVAKNKAENKNRVEE